MTSSAAGVTTQRWLGQICASRTVATIGQQVQAQRRVVIQGSYGSSTTIMAGALAVQTQRPVLLVVAHLDEADDALEDLNLFGSSGLAAERFAALEVLPGETGVSLELLAQRLGMISRLVEKRRAKAPIEGVVIAPIQALMQAVPLPESLDQYQMTIKAQQQLPQAQLLDWLDRAGYQRTDAIEQPGDFATRGGIFDIYPPAGGITGTSRPDMDETVGAIAPFRLDYFGDEVETICRIDTDTMGSGEKIEQVSIIGASAQQLQSNDQTTHFLSLMPDDMLVVMHELMELAEQARGYFERLTNPRGIFPPQAVFKHLTSLPHVECNQYSGASADETTIPLPARSLVEFDQNAAKAVQELGQLACDPGTNQLTVFCRNAAEQGRLRELLIEHSPGSVDAVDIEIGYLNRGFVWEESGDTPVAKQGAIILAPHHELFHRYETRRRIRQVSAHLTSDRGSQAFLDVETGDYVVHVDHGIARLAGLKTMTRHGKTEEYLTLEFAQNALLHVPATQIDLVQRYVGGFSGKPPLSLLGGKRWAKQKESAEEAVKDLAVQLLQVQAARASLPGLRFPVDTPWQAEFEAEFPYDETEDQLAAIAQVKRDMADEQPMDRLICGDVGFGKTEIAIRAAFKAAQWGKQVAILVPTTVLAEQHERTFKDRMANYPFIIASLSRFKTGKQQSEILKAVQQGAIDIVIGTHRLLSRDVEFADLGLVVIDEEQRFGVEHKQRLLQFRLTADVLTLTATPIPRTLHMAMLGLRDISSLATPPLDRRAIVTEVIPYNQHRIKQAIIRELNRDGQTFFVHNRVHNIQAMADDIQKLVPDARIIIGHGQMSTGKLEKVMLMFTRRQADVLVCTTIIESGIDIPTANTIFINQADHFGLADLHQLRGRVGRYKHRAYCYLLLPENRTITDTAARRLKALERYAMLGAGFKIAMRDLEIRGAGNLLGAEQSGHIAAVGYELYCNLLEQAAKRLKSEPIIEPVRTHIELPLAGQLSRKYIMSDKFRMEAYRRLSRAATLEQLDTVAQDLADAYGAPPASAKTLLELTELRIAASTLGINSIKLDKLDLIFRSTRIKRLEPILKDAPGRVTVIDQGTVYYRPPENHLDPPKTLVAILRKLLVTAARQGRQ